MQFPLSFPLPSSLLSLAINIAALTLQVTQLMALWLAYHATPVRVIFDGEKTMKYEVWDVKYTPMQSPACTRCHGDRKHPFLFLYWVSIPSDTFSHLWQHSQQNRIHVELDNDSMILRIYVSQCAARYLATSLATSLAIPQLTCLSMRRGCAVSLSGGTCVALMSIIPYLTSHTKD